MAKSIATSSVKECRELEEGCGVAFTGYSWGRSLEKGVRRVAHEQLLKGCAEKAPPPLPLISEVEEWVGWEK